MEEDRQELATLWAYYTAAAEIRGRSGRERTVAYRDRLLFPQSPFSLFWFFWQDPEDLNPLTRAFLGDEEAMGAIAPAGEPPEGWDRWRLEGSPLDENQEAAIRAALAAPLSFIQGPPGTGKTETILNLANRAARLGKTVAIVSTNNSALENIVEKIGDPRVDGQPGWIWLRRRFARLGKTKNRLEFRGCGPGEFRFQNVRETIGPMAVSREGTIRAEDFLGEYPVITSTIHSLKHCFRDGLFFRYDYVIMDESSQTDAVAGLVAMSAARRLVLVGDPKQLPPVIGSDFARELTARAEEEGWALPENHLVREDRSFLDACLDVFGERTAKTVLRFHYRCHPGIIRFCAREIYREEGLEVRTPNYDRSVRAPIKALWFEGNYCERRALPAKEGEAGRISKHNQKQVRCFMEEEWPRLRERVLGEDPPSVCILSPFRGQLASLDKAIREDLARRRQGAEVVLEDGRNEEDGCEPPMLTIHKAQGRGYDIIYLLPVEDGDWEWPWSQKMRLINVAVSRAKKELRVILSTALMEQSVQEELTGHYIRPEEGDASPGEEKDQRFLQKLVSYIREENLSLEKETGVMGYPDSGYEYGFHPSGRRSVFDRLPQKRQEAPRGEGSTPERCVEAALEQLLKTAREKKADLAIYRNVPFRALRDGEQNPLVIGDDRRELNSIRAMGHLDFVVCRKLWKTGREQLLLAVEVDGEYHRKPDPEGEAQRERDERKDTLVRELLGACCFAGNSLEDQQPGPEGTFAFLRLPTDGTTCLETRALWKEAPEELKSRYFTLEDLLEARLEQPRDRGWYLSVSSLPWLCRRDDCREKSAKRARWRLESAGLLRRDRAPTREGRELGLIGVTQLDRFGRVYGDVVCARQSQGEFLDILNDIQPVNCLLDEIFQWFKGWMDRQENDEAWRELNDSQSFADGVEPDYSRKEVQALYLLRLLTGYAYEYRELFGALFAKERWTGERLQAVSLGCGNMIDYWGLHAALEGCPDGASGVDYTGVDLNGWAEEFRVRAARGDTARFVRADAVAWLGQPDLSAPDVYLFPKSISEFGGEVFEGIRDGIRGQLERSGKDRVCLLFALRPPLGEDHLPLPGEFCLEDRAKCDLLRKAVEEAGYRLAGGPEPGFGSGEALRTADRAFGYPDYIMNWLREKNCRRDPLLRTGHIRRLIYRFRKG